MAIKNYQNITPRGFDSHLAGLAEVRSVGVGRVHGKQDLEGFQAQGWETYAFHNSQVSDGSSGVAVNYGPTLSMKREGERIIIGFGKNYVGGWVTAGVSEEEKEIIVKGLVDHLRGESVVSQAG